MHVYPSRQNPCRNPITEPRDGRIHRAEGGSRYLVWKSRQQLVLSGKYQQDTPRGERGDGVCFCLVHWFSILKRYFEKG